MNQTTLFLHFGISLSIGILIGMQREFAKDNHEKELAAGIRTFGLLSVTGCAAALLSDLLHSPFPFVGIILTLGSFFAINYYVDAKAGKPGLTTKSSLILTLICGSLAYWPQTATLSIALAVATTVILSVKVQLHRFVSHLTQEDIQAALKFAVISAIVLPILPDKVYGPPPFDIFNPLKLWLFVVLISAISFVGYVFIKVAGSRKGIGLTGILGGLASSTAVTVSFTGKSKESEELSRPFALAIIMAWTIMFVRVFVVVAVLNKDLIRELAIPFAGCIVVGLVVCAILYRMQKTERHTHDVPFNNPFELGLAIKFGLLFALILLFSRTAQVYFGDLGVYLSSFFAGMADVDAIAFSMAKLAHGVSGLNHSIASRAIVIAAIANTIVKGSIVMFGGSKQLKRAVLPGFILMTILGITLAFLV